MKRRKGLIGSARATRRSKRIAVAEKVDDEPESQQLGVSFDELPSHITTHILRRLPVKSVLICKSVCTRWNGLISDPHFAKLHFQHAPAGLIIRALDRELSRNRYLLECESEKLKNDDIGQFCFCEDSFTKPECNCHFKLEHKLKFPLDLEKSDETKKRGGQSDEYKFHVVNSCNGLLCLSDMGRNCFVVCNPVTGEFIRLPAPTKIGKTDYICRPEFGVGFGFQPETNEYKVVRIIFKGQRRLPETEVIMGVEIHTLGTSTWRNVEVDPRHVSRLCSFPTYMGGALYWISDYHMKSSISCFDFESESFQSFSSPPRSIVSDMTMGEYEGSLYICDTSSTGHVNMWIMKKSDFEASWTNVFSIDITSKPKFRSCWPVKLFKNGGAVLMYHSSDCFIYYEPEKYQFKILKIRGTRYVGAIPHIPSLISLKDAVKGDNIEVMTVNSRCEELKLQEEKVLFLAKVNELTNLCYVSSDDKRIG